MAVMANFKCILVDTYESFEGLRCCICLRIFMSRFEMTLLHPYESAEALCRRRNKVSTTAKWQVVWADSRWYGPAMMSNGLHGLSYMNPYGSVPLRGCGFSYNFM